MKHFGHSRMSYPSKVSIFPLFFWVTVAKITKRKNVFVFVVGHAYTRWRDFMSFVNDFQQIS